MRTLLCVSFTVISVEAKAPRREFKLITRDMMTVLTISKTIVEVGVVVVGVSEILLNTTFKTELMIKVDVLMDIKDITRVITVLNTGKWMNGSINHFSPMVSLVLQI